MKKRKKGKYLQKRKVLSLEWKSDGVMDNESDESMEPTEEVHSKDWVSQNWKDYCVVDAVGQ